MKLYSIVCFLDDDSVDVVSSSWVYNCGNVSGSCWWPPHMKPSQLSKAIEQRVPYQIDWDMCIIKLLAETSM